MEALLEATHSKEGKEAGKITFVRYLQQARDLLCGIFLSLHSYPSFAEEKTEARRSEASHPKSHSKDVAEPGFKPGRGGCQT